MPSWSLLLEFAQIVILLHFHFWKSLKSSFCSISTFGICSNRHFVPFPLLEITQIVVLLHFHFWNLLKSSFCPISTFGICSNRRFAPFPLLEFAQIVILPHFHFWNLLKSSFWGRQRKAFHFSCCGGEGKFLCGSLRANGTKASSSRSKPSGFIAIVMPRFARIARRARGFFSG